ncbi:hypothetical protein BH11MYX3_BH11MYX3_17260 [soil metagenome]
MAACSSSEPPEVRISEILYHPAAERAYDDVAELVELVNTGSDSVALEGWHLVADHVDYTLPAVTLPVGGYLVVAKDTAVVTAAWGLDPAIVVGDFAGNLDNGKDDLQLVDPAGAVEDRVVYTDEAPWPVAADALGAGADWLPISALPLAQHEHKGYSLERVSLERPASEVANWVPSALDGATPGAPNGGASTQPPAIVTSIERHGGTLAITTSDHPGIASIDFEWCVDDLAIEAEPTTLTPMVAQASGQYTADLPAFADHTIVRYRFRIDSGAGPTVVSPRPTDPYAWHAFAVVPKIATTTELYQVYIAPAAWGQMWTNIENGRDSGCTVSPTWEDDVPAVIVHDGDVYDVRARYQGSRYNRKNGPALPAWPYPGPTAGPNPPLALSWHFSMPRYKRIRGRDAIILNKNTQGCPGYDASVGFALWRQAKLPAPRTNYARLEINGGYYHYMLEIESPGDAMMKRFGPVGRLYKSSGQAADGNALGVGDDRPLAELCGLTRAQRYELTYDEHTNTWESHDELISLFDDLDAARKSGVPAIRQLFADRFDLEGMLDHMALINWSVPFDDMFQNHFLYRKRDGRWLLMPWDLDLDFGGWKDASASLYIGEENDPDNRSGWSNVIKDAFIKAYRSELDARMRLLVTTVLAPASVAALVDAVTQSANPAEAAAAPAGLGCSFPARADSFKAFAVQRQAVVNARTAP